MIELHSSPSRSYLEPTKSAANPCVTCTTSWVSPWLSPLAYLLGQYLLVPSFFGKITITGQKNIPTTGPVILAPTHRSRWDALLVPYAAGRCATGRDLRFMVLASEFSGLQGWLIRHLGGFPVDGVHPSITTLRHAVNLLVNSEMLVMFPEGGIRKGKLHPLKQGISRLALNAEANHSGLGVQIIPMSINYSQLNPSWGTNVSIHIGSPLKVTNYLGSCSKVSAKSLTSDLSKALQELSHHRPEVSSCQLSVVGR